MHTDLRPMDSARPCSRIDQASVESSLPPESARLTTGPAAPTALYGSAGPTGLLRCAPVARCARLDNRNISLRRRSAFQRSVEWAGQPRSRGLTTNQGGLARGIVPVWPRRLGRLGERREPRGEPAGHSCPDAPQIHLRVRLDCCPKRMCAKQTPSGLTEQKNPAKPRLYMAARVRLKSVVTMATQYVATGRTQT